MTYPRLCAHRGFGKPENSLPALSTAVVLGTQEIEFDLWPTTNSEIVSIHNKTLERVSNGSGSDINHSYTELYDLMLVDNRENSKESYYLEVIRIHSYLNRKRHI